MLLHDLFDSSATVAAADLMMIEMSSQLAEPLWTDPGLKSGISARELISIKTKNKTKNAQVGNEWSNVLPKFSQARKKPLIVIGKFGRKEKPVMMTVKAARFS